MNEYEKLLRNKIFNTSVEDWLWFLGIIVIGLLFKRLLSRLISRLFYKLVEDKEVKFGWNTIDLLRKPIEFLLTLIIISLALDEINISSRLRIIPLGKIQLNIFLEGFMDTLFIVAITWLIIRIIKLIALIQHEKALQTQSRMDEHLTPFIRDIAIAIVVFCSFFFILGYVFKQNVASFITGLGIGGVAAALAARETLENFFASFTIFTDQPFIVGDDIEVKNFVGTVQKVGFRSTKLRNYDGSYFTIPNKMLVSETLNNLSERNFRRVKQYFNLSLDTPVEKLRPLLDEIKTFILKQSTITNSNGTLVLFDFVGDYSIKLLVVYYLGNAPYNDQMLAKESINLKIKEIIEKLDIAFAQSVPTVLPS